MFVEDVLQTRLEDVLEDKNFLCRRRLGKLKMVAQERQATIKSSMPVVGRPAKD